MCAVDGTRASIHETEIIANQERSGAQPENQKVVGQVARKGYLT